MPPLRSKRGSSPENRQWTIHTALACAAVDNEIDLAVESPATCCAVVGETRPDRSALGETIENPAAASKSRAAGCAGIRIAIRVEAGACNFTHCAIICGLHHKSKRSRPEFACKLKRAFVENAEPLAASISRTCVISGLTRADPSPHRVKATAWRMSAPRAKAVNRLGRKRDEPAIREARALDPCILAVSVGGQNARFYAGRVVAHC